MTFSFSQSRCGRHVARGGPCGRQRQPGRAPRVRPAVEKRRAGLFWVGGQARGNVTVFPWFSSSSFAFAPSTFLQTRRRRLGLGAGGSGRRVRVRGCGVHVQGQRRAVAGGGGGRRVILLVVVVVRVLAAVSGCLTQNILKARHARTACRYSIVLQTRTTGRPAVPAREAPPAPRSGRGLPARPARL